MKPLGECQKLLTRDSILSRTFTYFGNYKHINHVIPTSYGGGTRFEKNSIYSY